MQTRLITTEEELVRLQSDWDVLVRSNPDTDMPFYGWDWFYRSWLHFSKPAGHGLFVVAVYDGEQIAGLLPLVRRVRKSMKIAYRLLSICNVGMMPRNTMYTDPQSDQEKIFQAAWEHLFNERSNWDMIELGNVLESIPFHRFVLEGQHNTKYALIQNRGFIAPYIELTGTLEDYLNGLSKGTRKDLRKHVKHFKEGGTTQYVRFYETPDEILDGLKHLETVHSRSWKGAYQNQHDSQFYEEITPILAQRGEAKIAVAFLDDVPIGGAYMLIKNGVYYGCIRDYDPHYREYAPGILLLHYQLEHLLQESGKIFDFCGTTSDLKEKFGTGHQNHSTFQIFHADWKSRFLYSAKTFWLPMVRKILHKSEPKEFVSKTKRF